MTIFVVKITLISFKKNIYYLHVEKINNFSYVCHAMKDYSAKSVRE